MENDLSTILPADLEMTASRSLPDEVLMGKVRDDDCRISFRQLFDRWQLRIHRTCLRLTGNWQDAEDIAQDVFSRLYQTRKRYLPAARFSTFVWQIAVNRCRDHAKQPLRDMKRRETSGQLRQLEHTGVAPSQVELADAVQAALAKLASEFREVLVLRHYENLKFREIAELLDIPTGTVASRMAKALGLVADKLKTAGFIKTEDDSPDE